MPMKRIICAGMQSVQRLAHARIRHAIVQMLPKSTEHLFRASKAVDASGEGGRCTVLLSGEEVSLRENQNAASSPSYFSIRSLMQSVFRSETMSLRHLPQLNGPVYAIRPRAMATQYQLSVERIFGLFDFLDRKGFIKQLEERQAVVCRYRVLQKLARLKLDAPPQLIKYLLDGGWTGEWDLFSLSESLGLDVSLLAAEICEMEDQDILKLQPLEWLSLLMPQKHPSVEEIDSLARAFHANLKEEAERLRAAGRSLVQTFTTAQCMMVSITEELGVQMPGGVSKCGRCTFCVTGKPVVVRKAVPQRVNMEMARAIYDGFPEFRHEPRFLARVALGMKPIVSGDNHLASKINWENPHMGSLRFCEFKVS